MGIPRVRRWAGRRSTRVVLDEEARRDASSCGTATYERLPDVARDGERWSTLERIASARPIAVTRLESLLKRER